MLRLMLDPRWAPAVVAIAFLLCVGNGIAERFDYVFHIAGGAAIAYFVFRTTSIAPSFAERIAPRKRQVFALITTILVAALWEGAEFLADARLGTRLQQDPLEAPRDFGFSVVGGLLACAVAFLASRAPTSASQRH